MNQLPDKFLTEMKRVLGEEGLTQYLKSYDETRRYGLRVNTNKLSPQEFLKLSPYPLRQVPWIANGFFYDEEYKPAKHPYYYAGLYYLQEPSAMTPANLLPIEPGERVLDLCAAPGGKSTELGARLQGEGVLVANDISSSRAKALLKNLELFGIGNVLVTSETPDRLASYFPSYFDKILVDAPCSGEGMFRKDSAMVKSWLEHGPEYFAAIQKQIMVEAVKMLRPGGMLLYSTCTFSPLEDEGTITWLLEQCPEMSIVPLPQEEGFSAGQPKLCEGGPKELCGCIRLFPHKIEGEGHFLALLKKAEGEMKASLPAPRYQNKDLIKASEWEEFCTSTTMEFDPGRLDVRGERVFYMPADLGDLRGIRFLRSGLYLGDIKKNRFEPSQALAMCLKKEQFSAVIDLPVEDERVIRYLKGETIALEENEGSKKGWQLVCVDGYPLGFGKRTGSTLKNKYHSGWRWQ